MVSRKLMGVWAVVDFLLLVAGAVSIALSIVWRKKDPLMNMVLSASDLTAGLVLGIMLVITFVISIAGVVQRNHITLGLVITNWVLMLDGIAIIVIGSFVWFFTLRERANFHELWIATTPDIRLALQDQLKCCGYFFANDTAEINPNNFCSNETFVRGLNDTIESNFCVQPITKFADQTLNNIFTTVYGFMAIVICLLLATLCVIKKRHEDERFKKIDAKRGGKGFV